MQRYTSLAALLWMVLLRFPCNIRTYYIVITLIDRGNDFSGSTIGIAYLNTMCGSASVGIVQDRHRAALATGSTFAHEMGHLFGMDHDSGEHPYTSSEPWLN